MKIYRKNKFEKFTIPYYRSMIFYMILLMIAIVISYLISLMIPQVISLTIALLILFMISLIILIVISYKKIKLRKGYYFKALPLEKSIRKSLIDTMQLNNIKQTTRIEVPDIIVDFSEFERNKKIKVLLERLPGMDNIEKLIPLISNSFKKQYSNFAVVDYIENENKLDYLFILEDVKKDKRLIPKNMKELLNDDLYKFKLQKSLTYSIDKNPHLICSGVTGSGKSTLLISLLAQSYNRNIKVYLIDPKREFTALNSISDPIEILEILRNIVDEMEDREKEIGRKITKLGQNAKSFGYPPTMIFIDELTALVAAYDNKQKKEFDTLLRQLVLKGRANSFFVNIFLQNANSETISVAVRNNLTCRITLGQNSNEDYRFIFGTNTETISNDIPAFTGYILIKSVHTTPQRFFVPNLIKHNLNTIEKIKGE